MIKLYYFDFNFWRLDVCRLTLSYGNIPYEYIKIPRATWIKRKKQGGFPFGQLPVMKFNNKTYGQTSSIARFCARKANLYEKKPEKSLIIDQVLDWANDITYKIAPSIREKNKAKQLKLRKRFVKIDLDLWFSFLENLLRNSSNKKKFFTDKFSLADITAWRLIYWFCSEKLDGIDKNFIHKFSFLNQYYHDISEIKKFNELGEYKKIISN
jgi:glutathione S-transferase